ncbi:MAG: cysteine hydrolase [Patescibacteria group bacterium]|nr:cysteine hydrolase [Patescibacteria group bacterium]
MVLIDMQEYFTCKLLPKVRKRMVYAQRSVLITCADVNIPVVILEYAGCGSTIPALSTVLGRVARKVIVAKVYDNGFRETRLQNVLQDLGVTSILIMGINAHMCVLRTAKSAVQKGYKVHTSELLIAQSRQEVIDHDCRQWYLENGCLADLPIAVALPDFSYAL